MSYTVSAYDAAGNTSAQSGASISTPSSSAIGIGSRVQTTANLNVRTKPSTSPSSKVIGMQPSGAFVTVVGGPTTASGYTWWNVNFDSGADRWVVATYLAKSVALLPASTPIAASMTTSDKLSTLASLEAQVEALLAAIASLKSQLVAGGKCV